MTDYTEAAKQLLWDEHAYEHGYYRDLAAKAAAEAEARAAQVDVVARAIYATANTALDLFAADDYTVGEHRRCAEAAIAAYLSTVPKQDATTQGRISYG